MAQYRRKVTGIVEANQYLREGPQIPGVQYSTRTGEMAEGEVGAFVVTIHSQVSWLEDGDWVVQEPDGVHFYPVKPKIFAERYELVEETPDQAIDENFSHFVTHSGLGEKPPVVEQVFDARTGKQWIVGKSLGASNHWEFQGVFDNEPAALRACPFGLPYFVAPVMLNEVLPQATLTWKGLYWPAMNTGDASNVIRKMASYDRA